MESYWQTTQTGRRFLGSLATSARVIAGTLAAAALLAGHARADTHYFDTSWIADGNPVLINQELASMNDGDIAHFLGGTYQLGLDLGYITVPKNITFEGDTIDPNNPTIFRGANPGGSIPVIKVTSSDCLLQDFRTEYSYGGILINGVDYENIHCLNLSMYDHSQSIVHDEQNAPLPTTSANVIVENILFAHSNPSFRGTGNSIVYGKIEGATDNTKYAAAINCTFDGQGTCVGLPVVISEDGRSYTIKGFEEQLNNVVYNSTSPFVSEIYPPGMDGRNPVLLNTGCPAGTNEAENNKPSLYALGYQPETGMPNLECTVEDLKLDQNGKPTWGSILVNSGYAKGYAGAKEPAYWTPRIGDLNCDGSVDFGDINPFVLRLSNPGGYSVQYAGCPDANGDVNENGGVGFDDINPFVALLCGN